MEARGVHISGGGGLIWEECGIPAYITCRGIASRGIAEVADLYDGEGGIMTWEQARDAYEITPTYTAVYGRMRERLMSMSSVREWCAVAAEKGRAAVGTTNEARMEEWEVERLIAARKGPTNWGGWEYLVQWVGGVRGGAVRSSVWHGLLSVRV